MFPFILAVDRHLHLEVNAAQTQPPPGLSAHIFGHLHKILLTEALAVILTEHSDGRKETGGVTGQHHPADQVTCLSCPRASKIMTLSLALIILPSCDVRLLTKSSRDFAPRVCRILVATTVSLQQPVRSLTQCRTSTTKPLAALSFIVISDLLSRTWEITS